MKIYSPIANFTEVLAQVNHSAVQYGPKFKTNEAATRAALIDPILKALGWDITNPDMVELEKNFNNTKLDYGLMDLHGKVCTIVEAKALGVNLSDPMVTTKLFAYGFTHSIQNIILTDGIIWQHYLQVTPGNMTPECIDISKDDIAVCADFFINKVDAFRFWTTPIVPPVISPGPTAPVPVLPVPQPTPNSGFTPLNALSQNLHGQAAPKSMRLPDGNIVPIHYWRDVLVECVKFVLNAAPNIPIPLPDKAGKKTSLLSPLKPANGIASVPISYNGNTVYIYINYDVTNIVANSKYILGYLPNGKSWQTVEVKF